MHKLFLEARGIYGTRRLKVVLEKRYGIIVSRRNIQKSLNQLNLKVKMKRRYKVITTTSNHKLPISPNYLERYFYTDDSNKVYVGDITFIPTNEGWLYLAFVIDMFSRKGDCWDNAVAESFFHSLKTELVHHEKFISRAQANEKIFEYIEIFYNRKRIHSSNNYMSPYEFEEVMLQKEMSGYLAAKLLD